MRLRVPQWTSLLFVLSVLALVQATLAGPSPKAGSPGAPSSSPTSAPSASAKNPESKGKSAPPGAPTAAPAAPPAGLAKAKTAGPVGKTRDETHVLKLRDLESRIDELKEQIRRSHARLSLLSETLLSGGLGGARADLVFKNQMSNAFRIRRILVVLDGAVQYKKQDETDELSNQKEIPVFTGPIPPGDHTLQVVVGMQGHGYGIFSYLRAFKPEVKHTRSFTVEEGKAIRIEITAWEKGSATTPLEERPALRLTEKIMDRREAELDGGGMILERASFASLWILATVSSPAWAKSEGEARASAEQTVSEVEKALPRVMNAKPAGRPTPEQRLAAGEVFLRQHNHERAGEVFGQVVELFRQGQTSAAVHADALFLLAESYFRADELLASRRHYMDVIGLGETAPYDTYAGRALSRLVDVALRTDRRKELDFVLSEVERMGAKGASTSLRYAKAKALFALEREDEAERLLGSIPKTSAMYPQAQYILGVIYMKRALGDGAVPATRKEASLVPTAAARFAKAVLQFQKVATLEVTTEDHRHVVDLAWMALGRLFYEVDDLLDAADAHARVRRDSPEFADMLFELSWVYVRLSDFERAERGLEVLGVVSPDKLDFAEGALLRADLMLRSKQYDEALSAYRAVHRRFEPIEAEVDAFVAKNSDPGRYYDRLIEDRLGVRTRGALPLVVMDWLKEESEHDRVFALIDDMTISHEVMDRSRRIIQRLSAVLASPVRVRGFPEIAAKLQGIVGLQNQIALARRDLALALEESNSSALDGEIERARRERRATMDRMRWFPTAPRDFAQRESSGLRRFNGASQKLQRLQLEVDRLQATANSLARLLTEKDRFGVSLDRGTEARIESELGQTEREIDDYLSQIEGHRERIEASRLQVGFGDARYQNDDQARDRFSPSFEREMELAMAGQAGPDAAEFAREVRPLVERLSRLDQQLAGLRRGLEADVREGVVSIEQQVLEEQASLEEHQRRLETLDSQARTLVGEAAMRDFGRVRERLKGIVLRADVGITHQAWEVRERHLQAVQRLQRDRALEERSLEQERDEVMFQGGQRP